MYDFTFHRIVRKKFIRKFSAIPNFVADFVHSDGKIYLKLPRYCQNLCKKLTDFPDFCQMTLLFQYAPWDWNIYLPFSHRFQPHVSKFSSPMEHLGLENGAGFRFVYRLVRSFCLEDQG